MKTRNYKHKIITNTQNSFQPFIDDNLHIANEKAILKFIKMLKKWQLNQYTPDVMDYFKKLKFAVTSLEVNLVTDREIISKCMASAAVSVVDTDNSKEHGSAMFPVYNNVWNIGIFGSIWLDIDIEGKGYRLSFYNEAPPIICINELT